MQFSTDSRKILQLRLDSALGWNDDRQPYAYNVNLSFRIRPASNIEFSVGSRYSYQANDAQWVEQVEENLNGRYWFGM